MRIGKLHSRPSVRLSAAGLALAAAATLTVTETGAADAAPVVDPTAGKVVAHSGFDVRRDGFSFENWGDNGPLHRRGLTIDGMRAVFGDEVCARIVLGICSPTTVSELVQDVYNDMMTGGHCYGMAALAGLYATKRLDKFPLAMPWQTVYSMPPSAPLDELIARMFVTQGFPPSDQYEDGVGVSEALSKLRAAWKRNDNYILAVYTDDERTAGHAINPIAIRDLRDGKYGIVVYDNNFPGQEKMVVVDPAADTWYYSTATNPSEPTLLFQGSQKNRLILIPVASALARHHDPDLSSDDTFVMVTDTNGGARGAGDVDWKVRVTDLSGNPIRGVEQRVLLNNDNAAQFTVPAGKKFRVVVDGVEAGKTADIRAVAMSAGGAVGVGDLEVPSGATAALDIDPVRHSVRVTSSAPTTADFEVATEDSLRSVSVDTSQLAIGPGSAVSVGANSLTGVTLQTQGRAQKVSIAVERSDTIADRNAVTRAPITLRPGAKVDVPVNLWTGWNPIAATVRAGNSTTIVPLTMK
ncbi:hypothetical protein GP2_017_00800 [Gordonia paraffinivorans NBRC 108238]|uniref:Peptidase C39-like domain-containing protein n=2 Tax=Gordonia paraffinivorans TaxID=175628 RepID=A0ABQ0IM54_9ACTN|nr:hypothetical protein [Gordonia paraffinivorans]GAC84051.1 hypothetical protein GP2_017_00800 [Gordonia paraffinivorans NBRC 108238]VFA88921.1 Uncharacterised protein [Gordonia paraffinivorans]